MRTALLETRTAKSMWVNDKNNFLQQNFVLFKMSDESEYSESKFYYLNCLMQNYLSRQLTPKAQKESQHSSQVKKFTTFSEVNNKQTGCQENNFSGWTVR